MLHDFTHDTVGFSRLPRCCTHLAKLAASAICSRTSALPVASVAAECITEGSAGRCCGAIIGPGSPGEAVGQLGPKRGLHEVCEVFAENTRTSVGFAVTAPGAGLRSASMRTPLEDS